MTLATILPTPRTVFLDTNDNPLAGGFVYTYIPNTTTPKTTWQDAGGVTANSNPIVLDGNGSCLLYGSGQYTLTVEDANSNLVYTGLSQDVAGLILAGNNTYTGNNTFEGTSTFTGGLTLPNNFVTNANLSYMAANTVKVNATNGLASPTDLALALNRLLGRGASGNIAPITLGTGLSMTGDVLNGFPGVVVTKQIFTTTRTYTPTTGMLYCIVECLGAGGGGGGGAIGGTNVGAGGGSGGYGRSWLSAATIGSSQSVTIGAAGAGGASTGGATGGTTTFGALMSSAGGVGGLSGSAVNALGGTGGVSSNADLNISGNSGNAGISSNSVLTSSISGSGANSFFGAGGKSIITGVNGTSATGYGAGGGGAIGGAGGTTGGSGTAGLVVVTEYCS